jgi:hypothetical protein
MSRQTVVVIEEAIADEDSGLGKVRPQGRDERLGLRMRGIPPSAMKANARTRNNFGMISP